MSPLLDLINHRTNLFRLRSFSYRGELKTAFVFSRWRCSFFALAEENNSNRSGSRIINATERKKYSFVSAAGVELGSLDW